VWVVQYFLSVDGDGISSMSHLSLEHLVYTLDVCISTPLSVDPTAFSLWLEGLSVAEAARELVTSYAVR